MAGNTAVEANKTVTETLNTATATATVTENAPVTAKDIMARTAKLDSPAPTSSDITLDDVKNINLDDIKDPVAKSLMQKRLKELESGFNKKYEQVSHKTKELDQKLREAESWTPEKLDRVLKDPAFVSLVQARQQHVSAQNVPTTWEGSADEWSALTPEEKHQFAQLNNRISVQEQMMNKMLQTEEDLKLKQLYPDYDASVVDKIQQDLMSNRLVATREHLWKVANFESAVERAYRLGLQDRNTQVTEKINASNNLPTHNVTTTGAVPEDVKKQGFLAIAQWRKGQLGIGKK